MRDDISIFYIVKRPFKIHEGGTAEIDGKMLDINDYTYRHHEDGQQISASGEKVFLYVEKERLKELGLPRGEEYEYRQYTKQDQKER